MLQKLECSLKLKIKHILAACGHCICKQQTIALYFEFENEVKFYILGPGNTGLGKYMLTHLSFLKGQMHTHVFPYTNNFT